MSLDIHHEEHPEHWKVDGWRIALEQCTALHQVVEMECKLYASLRYAVKRDLPTPLMPQLSRMCANRWNEIADDLGIPATQRR